MGACKQHMKNSRISKLANSMKLLYIGGLGGKGGIFELFITK
jgi:hypothetical protein